MNLDRRHIGRRYPATRPYEVSREKIREFAIAIGDPDPLYLDEDVARRAGFPDVLTPPTFPIVIAQPATRAVSSDPEVGVDYSRVVHGEQSFRHVRQLRPGDRVTAEVKIADIREAGENELITTSTELKVDGELVCVATSTLLVRSAEA